MNTIKIISNPYKKEIKFSVLNDATKEWEDVNEHNNPASELIKKSVIESFFPFKVKEIVDIIIREYVTYGGKLKLVFEGTDDEFQELQATCCQLDNVEVERSNKGLENARDILPTIIDYFSQIKPIVMDHISSEESLDIISHDISKFTEASDDIIPICVLGSYSSGKSTFINSLIGIEILPSGDMPVTAKVYRIRQLLDSETATISFKYSNYEVRIIINSNDYTINSDEKTIKSIIADAIESINEESLAKKVNKCLEVINNEGNVVDDLINIEIPFANGPLKDTKHSFVIFDTPGSNADSFQEHFQVLEKAMKELSNGVPIFVSEFKELDTCDNKNLFTKIKEIDQIDSRFTMIVVNKADSANIKDDTFDDNTVQLILSESVPRNLYSSGIYFVSSIMGLGAKNQGHFIDDHAEEFFEDNYLKYSKPDSKRYKELYKYDIMPDQIKRSIVDASLSSDDLIYANSGLLAIEHEIVNFADKYSAYDKCKQSNRYIDKIIDYTQTELNNAQETSEKERDELEDTLEQNKKELINNMEQKCNELSKEFANSYNDGMNDELTNDQFIYSDEDMRKLEQSILHQKQKEHKYSEKIRDVQKAGSAIIDSIGDIGKKPVGDYFKNVGDDIKDAYEKMKIVRAAKVNSDKDTVNEMMKKVSDDFNDRSDKAIHSLDCASRQYWEEKANEIKDELVRIISNSTTLEDEKKQELKDIIITYGDIEFKDDTKFKKAEFQVKLHLLWLVIDFNKVDIGKLTETYNNNYSNSINDAYNILKQSHKRSFKLWRKLLVDKLRNNIVSYNPKLLSLSQQIEKETKIIEELIDTEETLKNYNEEIISLMDWKDLM